VDDEEELRALVERARSAEPDAWEGLYRHAHPRLWAFARRRLATAEQAEDAVSEAMARAIASIDRFTWTGAGFDGWLFGILRNVVREAYRGTARNDRQLGVASDLVHAHGAAPDPLDHLVADEDSASLRAAFGTRVSCSSYASSAAAAPRRSVPSSGNGPVPCAWPKPERSTGCGPCSGRR
jgi:RNA polymerase sigma-70 factor (ECF subfamily)